MVREFVASIFDTSRIGSALVSKWSEISENLKHAAGA